MDKQRYSFDDLLAIMDRLRGPDGCPWDKQQTSRTLRTYFLEEVYEALDAIDRDDPDDLCEELGDSLFEIVFLAKVNQQQGRFDMHQVVDGIARKMIRRHPHIFNDTGERAETATEVEGIWARTKVSEKSSMSSILQGVPRQLPALLRAYRLSERAAKVGFDWPNRAAVLDKLIEEAAELTEARQESDKSRIEAEFGDLLFALVNLGRHMGVSAEEALRLAGDRFTNRFSRMEQLLADQGLNLQAANLEQMEQAWQNAKKEEQSKG